MGGRGGGGGVSWEKLRRLLVRFCTDYRRSTSEIEKVNRYRTKKKNPIKGNEFFHVLSKIRFFCCVWFQLSVVDLIFLETSIEILLLLF